MSSDVTEHYRCTGLHTEFLCSKNDLNCIKKKLLSAVIVQLALHGGFLKCLQVVNSLIVPEIGQMEHKHYEKYLIWLVISCIDSPPPTGIPFQIKRQPSISQHDFSVVSSHSR